MAQAIWYDQTMRSKTLVRNLVLIVLAILIVGGLLYWFLAKRTTTLTTNTAVQNTVSMSNGTTSANITNNAANTTTNATPTTPSPTTTTAALAEPIAEFKQRITKKGFGVYLTPQTSPVPNDRFTGYHTGVDVEYTDTNADVPIYAIADGHIVLARTASGYGGVMMLKFSWQDKEHLALYGHVRLSSVPAVGTFVAKGQQIGVLGKGGTSETGGERHHLHFDVLAGTNQDIRGYVQNKTDLALWLDPLSLYQ